VSMRDCVAGWRTIRPGSGRKPSPDSSSCLEEAATQINYRGNEQEVMDAVFKKLGLKEIEVTPDGHCLYSADWAACSAARRARRAFWRLGFLGFVAEEGSGVGSAVGSAFRLHI
jgi:hypothetical protein